LIELKLRVGNRRTSRESIGSSSEFIAFAGLGSK